LAKSFEKAAEEMNLSNRRPLVSAADTNTGMILGTAAYISPEQAKGLAVDRRTDFFALGCVLYEMLTGRVAFEETASRRYSLACWNANPIGVCCLRTHLPAFESYSFSV